MADPKRDRSWYLNRSGTRYVRDAPKPKPPKEKPVVPSKELLPFLKGEAEGDLMLAVIMAVRNLIRTPATYVKNARASNGNGMITDPTSPDAVRWNIFGALEYITYPNFTPAQKREVIMLIKNSLPVDFRTRLFIWEEDRHTTHAMVVNLLNQAIGVRKKILMAATPTSSRLERFVENIKR